MTTLTANLIKSVAGIDLWETAEGYDVVLNGELVVGDCSLEHARKVANDLYRNVTRGAAGRSTAPVRRSQSSRTPVPAGRYAVVLNAETHYRFFKVDTPTEGRWAGYTFVDEQASDEHWPVRGARKGEVLDAIRAAGPLEAMKAYGREIGECGHCGRTLTDPASIAAGIGPVCAGRMA